MRIELATGATYGPSKVTANPAAKNESKIASTAPQASSDAARKALIDKLSPAEANLLQKLFGDFNITEKKDIMASARPGLFVDIMV